MHIPIFARLLKMREKREIVIFGVLHDKEPSLFNQFLVDYDTRNLIRLAEVVRWIGEDQVEPLFHG